MLRKTLLLILVLIALATPSVYAQGAVVSFLLSGIQTLSNGGALSGGLVYCYSAGTTNTKQLYTDKALLVAATNPLVLDSDGRAIAYGSGLYKFIVKDSYGTTVFTVDNVEIAAIATLLDNPINPFGANLTQTNILITNATIASATISDLVVLHGVVLTDLDMNNTKITKVATGTLTTDATNLGQVQTLIASATAQDLTLYLKADGSNASFSQDISMRGYKLTNTATATAAMDVINKGQMDAAIAAIPLASSTPGTAGVATHTDLTNLSYATAGHTGFAQETGSSTVTFNAAGLTLAGETMTRISNIRSSAPASPQEGDIWIVAP